MKRIKQYGLCFLLVLLIAGACVQPFEPESFRYDRLIVVDGLITDQDKRQEINLSYTYPVGTSGPLLLADADVWVEDDLGQTYNFTEVSAGQYLSDNAFAGQVGRTYQLFFQVADGREFNSKPVELIKSPPIDSIYDRFSFQANPEGTDNDPGIQFFIDSHDDSGNSRFYRYEWEETFKIVTPRMSEYDYDRSTQSYFPRVEKINVCYESNQSANLILSSSLGTSETRVTEVPIRFVSGYTDLLRTRYSILVRQYATDAEAFNYYTRFKKINESGGSLFDIQQGIITGNISSSSHPDQNVLGYFEVSGVSEMRAFFNNAELDSQLERPFFRYYCGEDQVYETSIDSMRMELNNRNYYQIQTVDTRAFLVPRFCTDCTWYATPQKPAFWID